MIKNLLKLKRVVETDVVRDIQTVNFHQHVVEMYESSMRHKENMLDPLTIRLHPNHLKTLDKTLQKLNIDRKRKLTRSHLIRAFVDYHLLNFDCDLITSNSLV